MSSTNLSFRTPDDLMKKIRVRDIKGVNNPGAIAKRDIERWYSMLGESLLSALLDAPDEVVVMIWAVNWWLPTMTGPALVDLPDQLRQEIGLDSFYRDAQDRLATLLEGWPLNARAAVWDAAERYEVLVHREGQHPTFGGALHEVGLHSYTLDAMELATVESFLAVGSDVLPDAYLSAIERMAM